MTKQTKTWRDYNPPRKLEDCQTIKDIAVTEFRKPVVGFPGYEVDHYGNVYAERRLSGKINITARHAIILKPGSHPRDGHQYVGLEKDGKRHFKKVHHLVAEAFVPNPDNLKDVIHKNGNKKENYASNLKWGKRGVKPKNISIEIIKEKLSQGMLRKDIAKEINISTCILRKYTRKYLT